MSSGNVQSALRETVSAATSVTHIPDTIEVLDVPANSATSQYADQKQTKGSEDTSWEHDPVNPRNWSMANKWVATAIVSLYTFVSPLGSSMMAPGLPEVATKYHITDPTILALTLSIYLLSFAIGPLFLAPLSEMYGRVWLLHIGNLVYLLFNVGCALSPTASTLIGFRFLAGFAGGTPLAIGGGVIADLYAERDRASAMALYTMGPLMGPIVGPIMGGFIIESIGIQYVFYLIAGLCGLSSVVAIPLLRETYAPIIRLRRAKLTRDPEKATFTDANLSGVPTSKLRYLWDNLTRPMIILTHSFICFILSFYMALIYGVFYLMFATFPTLFTEVYHWSIGIGGLAYLGLGLGFLVSAVLGAKVSDRIYGHLAAKNGGKGTPEMRIPALIFASFFTPVGLLWYGWSAQAKIHWIMPLIGTCIYGFALMTSYLPIQLYLVDAFAYGASAIAAASVLRSFLGFIFPLFSEQMLTSLGYGWGITLLAGLAIVIGIPFPVWIYYFGERVRARSSLFR